MKFAAQPIGRVHPIPLSDFKAAPKALRTARMSLRCCEFIGHGVQL
jgi:hypothetical protein